MSNYSYIPDTFSSPDDDPVDIYYERLGFVGAIAIFMMSNIIFALAAAIVSHIHWPFHSSTPADGSENRRPKEDTEPETTTSTPTSQKFVLSKVPWDSSFCAQTRKAYEESLLIDYEDYEII
ncbi:hypothetical protein F4781DRAFT_427157 [Annulohypoxylon bovei var. microspora]|nr:hypothetical protein F4781DRAFT_427157 [Annulohypoxylon bovei var. microspora]